jgi:putative ATP-binding cassette transporter
VYLINGYFSNVVSFFSWKHDNFNKLTSMELAAKNIENIHEMIKKCQDVAENKKIQLARNNHVVSMRNLLVKSPEGQVLLKIEDLTFKEGVTLIQGDSGSGKTTLFRTLAGTWPHVEGELVLPEESAVHFVSQKPVFPLKANLYDAIFHEEATSLLPEVKEKMITLWKHFFKEKNPLADQEWLIERDWSKRLSVGEQRILVLIRAILKQPKVLFMDEPFAGLDKRKCERAISFLRQCLPADCKIIYIDHALEANSFCDNLLELRDGSLSPGLLLLNKMPFLNMHKPKATLTLSMPPHAVDPQQTTQVKPVVTQLVSSCG